MISTLWDDATVAGSAAGKGPFVGIRPTASSTHPIHGDRLDGLSSPSDYVTDDCIRSIETGTALYSVILKSDPLGIDRSGCLRNDGCSTAAASDG